MRIDPNVKDFAKDKSLASVGKASSDRDFFSKAIKQIALCAITLALLLLSNFRYDTIKKLSWI